MKSMDIGKMIVHGRHPEERDTFVIEHECDFVIYVLKGTGLIYAGDEIFNVQPEDVIFVPHNNKFAVEGELEYITFDNPAFSPEQSEVVKVKI